LLPSTANSSAAAMAAPRAMAPPSCGHRNLSRFSLGRPGRAVASGQAGR
jgi:hypothetical protein